MQSRRTSVIKSTGEAVTDLVACEEPLEIRLLSPGQSQAESLAITMRTPGDDADLVRGFLLGEGIVRRASDIVSIVPAGEPSPDTGTPNQVLVELGAGAAFDSSRLVRHFVANSSCGICGKASMDALADIGCEPVASAGFMVTARVLIDLPDQLAQHQSGFSETGGLHAAASFLPAGNIVRWAEDIGRHNALDKLIGSHLQQMPMDGLGVVVSSRASFELVQKVIQARCPMLVAVGAPSSLAIAAARRFGVTLVGFLRNGRFNIYSHESRVLL